MEKSDPYLIDNFGQNFSIKPYVNVNILVVNLASLTTFWVLYERNHLKRVHSKVT